MSDNASPTLFRSPVAWLAVTATAMAIGVFYWQAEQEKARQKLELDRIAAEQAEQRRAKEAEARRERDRQRILEEIRAQKEAEEEQHRQSLAVRQEEVGKKQFVADDRYVSPQQSAFQSYQMLQDERRRNFQERAQRYEDDANLRRARQEVERQKRYVQQREYEEQAARARRDAAARYGN